jgi:alginate O-acetyltransferase complex protein AlgI
MVFSSAVFLFLFLPAVLCLYYLVPRRGRNAILLSASLFFYAWGEKAFVLVMLATIVANYVFGLLIDRSRDGRQAKIVVGIGVATNLAFLIGFKYANFLVDNLNHVLEAMGAATIRLAPVHLPIGISFFTFQAMSYIVDVYRGDVAAQRDLLRMALYKSLFPQLIAGPIVRYRDIAGEIAHRTIGWSDFAAGTRRFIIGLGKKVLIANTLAVPADAIFSVSSAQLTSSLSWLGIVCYSFQLYFDFSGYSDMAIGLGRMFGFHFRENFIYPYVSRSITEFWRRWHISLSTWFRDYLYIPLGGNRVSPGRTYVNLITVFLLCGLWHGAKWNFVVWGGFHGVLLVAERLGLGRWLEGTTRGRAVGHFYVPFCVIVGWAFFRAENVSHALAYLGAMFGKSGGESLEFYPGMHPNNQVWLALAIGVAASMPLSAAIRDGVAALGRRGIGIVPHAGAWAAVSFYIVVLLLSVVSLASGTHNPFIYFRF